MALRQLERTVVYIIDDDAVLRTGLTRLLRNAGLDPHPYASAEHFLAEFGESPRACILLDISLPEKAGCQLQARLRERRVMLPVIAVSAHDDAARARSLGARLFLRKPVDDQALLDAIHWICSGSGER